MRLIQLLLASLLVLLVLISFFIDTVLFSFWQGSTSCALQDLTRSYRACYGSVGHHQLRARGFNGGLLNPPTPNYIVTNNFERTFGFYNSNNENYYKYEERCLRVNFERYAVEIFHFNDSTAFLHNGELYTFLPNNNPRISLSGVLDGGFRATNQLKVHSHFMLDPREWGYPHNVSTAHRYRQPYGATYTKFEYLIGTSRMEFHFTDQMFFSKINNQNFILGRTIEHEPKNPLAIRSAADPSRVYGALIGDAVYKGSDLHKGASGCGEGRNLPKFVFRDGVFIGVDPVEDGIDQIDHTHERVLQGPRRRFILDAPTTFKGEVSRGRYEH